MSAIPSLDLSRENLLTTVRRRLAALIYPEGEDRRERAERAANFDDLTQVANRRALDLALPAAEADPTMLVILFDANNFGKINKIAGHSKGDEVLRELAQVIERCASRYGFGSRVFRAGGDEFVVLAAERCAGFIRDDVETEFGVREIAGVSVSVSGTIAESFTAADATLQHRKGEAKKIQ
jgi:diguanylate cyclase (GGDEF)-like protein